MNKSVYIHIPFCKNICSYCDFCKFIYDKKWINKYLNSLKKEIDDNYKNEIIDTIYIGGGTPSSLDIDELNILFDIVKVFNLSDDCEFTIECNIEDISSDKLRLFSINKVNRLSIGVQTFNDNYLKYLGRTYNKKEIIDKVNLAKKYFDNINIDLIYAYKNQTIDNLKDDLESFLKLDVSHISCYSLMIEEHTKLYINNEHEIDDELDYEMYKLIESKLNNKYNRYEVSNYAKKGYESRHNLKYWLNEEYYGFGLSAAGYIDNIRYTNTKNLSKYFNNDLDRKLEVLDINDKIKYELILGFRLTKGINKNDFYNKYSKSIYDVENINELINEGYLIDENDYIFVPKKYFYVLNDILLKII